MKLPLLALFSTAAVIVSFAQTAAQPRDPAPGASTSPPLEAAKPDEVTEMSPFTVSTESFQGYYASQTLAGSRLKTRVDEVASSIQILTPEFLDDVGATNATELFLYTTSTEASGINGNFSDFATGATTTSDAGARTNPQGSQRVRGLASADLTRNYFLSLLPSDRFNTESVEINRGANAMLFGLGSPAGIANTQLATAKFKNSREFRVDVDSEGSLRLNGTVNQVVIPKKLAVRFSAVRDDQNYYQKPAFENDHRTFGAVTARPWKNATLRGFVENGSRHANRPNTIPPASTIDSWFANQPLMVQRMRSVLAGIPGTTLTVPDNYALTYSAIAQSWRPNTTNSYLTSTTIPNAVKLSILRNAVIYHDNNATNPRMVFHPNMGRQIAAIYLPGAVNPGGAVGGGDAIESNISVIANPILALNPDGIGSAPAYNYFGPEQPWRTDPVLIPQSITDLSLFDFTRNSIAGNAAFQNDKWNHRNLVFEQTALSDQVGIELAYDYQTYERSSFVPFQNFSGIFVDLMEDYLGQPNPNLGRPFIMDRVNLGSLDDERESFRATAFARFDPERKWSGSRLARWVGKHTLTGVFSTYDQQQQNAAWGQYYQNPTGGFVYGTTDVQGTERRKVNNIIYLGDSILNAGSPANLNLQPLTNQQLWNPGRVVNLHTYNPTTRLYEDVALQTGAELINLSRDTQDIDTLALNWNATFLKNHLIGLIGWREDTVLAERRIAATTVEALADASSIEDPASVVSRIDETFRTTSWSLVAKWPESFVRLPFAGKVNFYYGESENFSLVATANDVFGGQLPSPSGNTKEYGITVDLLDSKLVLRLNRYESAVMNSAASSKYSTLVNEGIMKPIADLLDAELLGDLGAATTPNHAKAMQGLAQLKAIIPASTLANANLVTQTGAGYYQNRNVANLGDTQDIVGEGTELELIWNPSRNFRLALNVANQETIINNYAPRLASLWALLEPVLGPNGTIGGLRYHADASVAPPTYISYPVVNELTVAQWLETNVLSSYRNQKLQEGRVSNEQRAWRANVVANYSFTRGALRGFRVGSAVRWQDGAVIGYPTELIGDTLVADINSPHVAPAITNVDVWLRYGRRILKDKIDWEIEFRVQNLNHTAQDLIPVRSNLTTDYSVAQYRIGPPRVFSVANTFKF